MTFIQAAPRFSQGKRKMFWAATAKGPNESRCKDYLWSHLIKDHTLWNERKSQSHFSADKLNQYLFRRNVWLFVFIRLETTSSHGEGPGNPFGGMDFSPTSRWGQDLQRLHRKSRQRSGPRAELNPDNNPNPASQQLLPGVEPSFFTYLNVVIMGWQALRSRGRHVHIWANQGAKVAFQLLLDLPKLIL